MVPPWPFAGGAPDHGPLAVKESDSFARRPNFTAVTMCRSLVSTSDLTCDYHVMKTEGQDMPETVTPMRCTATVRKIDEDGRVSFNGFKSWYQVPADLMPVFREARKKRRQVRFTTGRDCKIYAAELTSVTPHFIC